MQQYSEKKNVQIQAQIQQHSEKKNVQIQTQQSQEQLEMEHLAKEKIAVKERADQQCLLALPLHTILWYSCYPESTKNKQQPQKKLIGIARFNRR